MSVLNCSDDGKLPAMFGRRKPIAPTSFTAPRRLSTKPVASNPQVRGTTRSLHWMTVLLALLASLIFVLADADQRRSAANIWMQITIEVTAALGLTWLVRRRMALTNDKPLIIPLLLIVVLLSVLWEPFQRWFFQTGRSFETMVMNSQKALMLAAAVFGYLVSYQRLSIGIGVALAIFSTAICQEHRVHWLIAIYGFAVVGWMIASHWDTLQSRLIGGETRRLPLRWLILGPSIPLLLVLASAAETLTTESRRWTIVSTNNRPWLDISGASRALGLSVGSEAHAVKVVNLRSNVIPVSLTLRDVHIDKVDQIALRIPQLVLASEAANESEKRTTGQKLSDIIGWIPELAADSELMKADFDSAVAAANKLSKVWAECVASTDTPHSDAAAFEPLIEELRQLVPKSQEKREPM